ncbi:hypothetical protein AZE42_13876 [Rhizopogon vesiculosus]|uniref:Uncharacterized protein n=1 Tax=Rhizopogon vesiculosus TaxID=180088 RepID=A0A1J8Q3P6_9AGAM|nr:hypothetical protein AZE42_13876 [Rhizopogon vesiculosus]
MPSKNNVLVQSLLETQRVTHVLLSALIEVTGVTESNTNTVIAMTVTSTLVTEVCAKQS